MNSHYNVDYPLPEQPIATQMQWSQSVRLRKAQAMESGHHATDFKTLCNLILGSTRGMVFMTQGC